MMQWRDRDGVELAAIATVVELDRKRVLDVGCGAGRLTSFAAAHAVSVHAFDPDAESVAKAQASLPAMLRRRVSFAAHSAEALDVPRRRFDIALCGWSLWCVSLEGVVHALCRIRAALTAGGLLVDTQPVSPHPPVSAAGRHLGALDMREWSRTIEAVDALVAQTVQAGLYSIEHERRFTVTDTWDSGPECAETTAQWQGTRLPDGLANRVRTASPPLTVHQEVRLRLLRAR